MSGAKMQIGELAAWGLDRDAYRPAVYRGDPESARTLLTKRAPFELSSALVESGYSELRERFAEQEARADLQAEMAGLDWLLGIVDLRFLLAFQRRIILGPDAVDARLPGHIDWDELMDFSFGMPKPVVCQAVRSEATVMLHSINSNLYFRFTSDSSNPIAIHSGSPFFEVAQYRDRWFLRDGYHRAFRCLQAGISHLPAAIVRARTLEELGAVHPWFFPEEVLFSVAPPRVIDFLNDEIVIEYHRSTLGKTLCITVEETYTLQGENV